jgi:U3 small nucleolar RNA-associated protein 3
MERSTPRWRSWSWSTVSPFRSFFAFEGELTQVVVAEALSTYLPTLAFYFSLLLSPAPSPDLLTKVLARLSSLRTALATMEELDLTSAQYEDSEEDDAEDESDDEEGEGLLASELWDLGGAQEVDSEGDSDEEEISEEDDMRMLMDEDGEFDSDEEDEVTDSMLSGLDDDELEALMADMAGDADADMLIERVKQVQRAKKGLPATTKDDDTPRAADARPKSSKKSKKNKNKEVAVPLLAPLPSRKIAPIPSSSSKPVNDDYLDPTSLSLTDSSDKASARHTLRFHVSQIHQKSVKRESGHGRRVGGDDDLPRRSKENARREVLKRQEHGGSAGEALDGMDWNEEDKKAARRVKGGDAGDVEGEEYYDLVKKGREEGRAAKKAKYDGERMAEKWVSFPFSPFPSCSSLTDPRSPSSRSALTDLSESSADGPRGATRKMLANKGLQPKRAKVNRNPRVKKRMAYDKAVKKVATMKAVYKGGDRSDYQGEKSGIGAKVVKSVRLGGA